MHNLHLVGHSPSRSHWNRTVSQSSYCSFEWVNE